MVAPALKEQHFDGACLLLLLLLLHAGDVASIDQCNICSANLVACVSESSYKFCDEQYQPQGVAASCGAGMVCSTMNSTFCLAAAADVLVACRGCNKCDDSKVFACIAQRTYALCLGTDTPSATTVGTCDADHVCNVNAPQICVSASTEVSTCSVAETTTTTTTTAAPTTPTTTTMAPVTNATSYCQSVQQSGRYSAGDPNCKKYVYCFSNNAAWYGQLYFCPGATYFLSSSQACISTVPEHCIAVATSFYPAEPIEDFWLQ